jgi:hypothetical protein
VSVRAGDAGGAGSLDQLQEQLPTDAAPAPLRQDRDRQLGDLLADESVTRRIACEEAVPGCTDGVRVSLGDHAGIPGRPQSAT